MQAPHKTTEGLSSEQLIRINGELVEAFLSSEVYKEIIKPLIEEGIASVSGRFTNGRFHHGDLTRGCSNRQSVPVEFLAGYQKGLMDLSNYIRDFVDAKDNLDKQKKMRATEDNSPMINPFMED